MLLFAKEFLIFAGHVKFTVLLWHVWGGKGNIAEAVF